MWQPPVLADVHRRHQVNMHIDGNWKVFKHVGQRRLGVPKLG